MERRMSLLKHRVPELEVGESPPRHKTDNETSRQCFSETVPSQNTEKSMKRYSFENVLDFNSLESKF